MALETNTSNTSNYSIQLESVGTRQTPE